MRDILVLFFCLILGINAVSAYELVLPKDKKNVVNTNYAFFVGKADKNEVISINDEKVFIAPNGAFAHTVKLKDGENRIIMKSNFSTQVYKFDKKIEDLEIEPVTFDLPSKIYKVKKDNTPLRKTPVNYGMNRLSHLFEGTNLLINGERGSFYRVFLSKSEEAWIEKTAVCEVKNDIEPKFITMNSETFKNASKHVIEFTEKLPYAIIEDDKEIVFKVYNPIYSKDSVYTFNINKPDKYFYETISHKGVYVFKVSELFSPENQTLEGINILVDAGHGGSEKGAVGCLNDKEKDINLKIANELKEILSIMGANVVMSRENDRNVSLDERIDFAHENCSNIFVSIHLNSIPDIAMNINKNRGTSVYYYNKNSEKLAKSVLDSVVAKVGTKKEGVKEASFAVLRPTEYIGILVEVAYMTNPLDSVIYSKENFSRDAASSIANGILNFVISQ